MKKISSKHFKEGKMVEFVVNCVITLITIFLILHQSTTINQGLFLCKNAI